jgi:hypothetical protein
LSFSNHGAIKVGAALRGVNAAEKFPMTRNAYSGSSLTGNFSSKGASRTPEIGGPIDLPPSLSHFPASMGVWLVVMKENSM